MKIIETIKKNITDKAGLLFSSYPVTMAMTIIITLLFSIYAILDEADHLPITSGQAETAGEYIVLTAYGLLISWTWMLFAESLRYRIENKTALLVTRIAVIIASLGSVAFFVCPKALWDKAEYKIISGEMPYAYMCVRLFVYCISAIAFITAIYFMYRRAGFGFNEYWLAALGETFKALAAYVLLLIGAEVVAWIFCTLITKVEWLYPVVGIVVTGLALVPLLLAAFCDIRDRRDDGFIRGLVKFVLVPLATIAYLIVYLYIIKIVIQFELPSNEVFTILSIVFTVGMPIWTIASAYEDKGYMKIVRWMPYMFAPFIVLQIICMGMRISEHGITTSRYMGVMLIVAEIIYLVIYVFSQVKKKDFTEYIMPVVCLLIVTTYLIPGINVYSSVIRSQKKVIEAYLDELADGDTENIPKAEMRKIRSAYSTIMNVDYGGERYIEKHIPEKAVDTLTGFDYSGDEREDLGYEYNISLDHYDDKKTVFDTADYSRMYVIDYYDSDIRGDDIHVYMGGDNDDVIDLDMTDLLRRLRKEYDEKSRGDGYYYMDESDILTDGYYTLPDGSVAYFESLRYYRQYSSTDGTLNLSGYLFVK